METLPLYPDSEPEASSLLSHDGEEADDEGISGNSDTSSSWSELVSPDHSSFEDEDEYNEDEFLGILSLARQAKELYSTTHAVRDLEDSIAYLRDALTVAPPDSLARADVLHMLAYDLYLLSQDSEELPSGVVAESLNDSVRLHRQALKSLPAHHLSRAIYFTRLAIALRARYLRANTTRDLDECIALHRRALSLRPVGHADRAQSLLNLANAYWTRFEHAGDMLDLDEAIQHDRETLELRPPGHLARSAALTSLATDLTARYRKTQQLPDLNEAISLQKEALELLEEEDVRGTTACQLAAHLVIRHSIEHRREDIETAAKIMRDMVHGGRAQDFLVLQILSEVYLVMGQDPDDADHFIESIRLHRSCMEHLPNRPDTVIRLAHALTVQHRRIPNLPDIDEPISLGTRALVLCSIGHPYRFFSLRTIARAYRSRFAHLHEEDDLNNALDNFAQAVQDPHTNIVHRLACAEEWIDLAKETERLKSQLEAYEWKMELLFVLICLRERFPILGPEILGLLSLGQDAALCALEMSDIRGAVDLLERGREMSWAYILRHRPADALPGDLSTRLLDIARKLSTVGVPLLITQSDIPVLEHPDGPFADETTRNILLANEFHSLVDEARQLRDSTHPTSCCTLASEWNDGPLIFLLAGKQHCEALVITHIITRLSLPLSISALGDLAANFADCTCIQDEAQCHRLLALVWKKVVEPIVEALGLKKSTGEILPRLWWCPTGAFSTIPLHAAGRYDGDTVCIGDYAISSYTPTMSALYRAQKRNRQVSDRVFIVSSNSTVKHNLRTNGPLMELLVKEGVPAETLSFHQRVKTDASSASILHFTCPTIEDSTAPCQNSFALADGKLTLQDLMSFGTCAPHLAFVNSVATKQLHSSSKVSDFYGSILQAGFRSVVCATWPVPDHIERRVTTQFYTELFKTRPADHSTAARILDSVIRNLRKQGAPCSHWMPYVYVGY